MRTVWVVALLAGCSFEHGVASTVVRDDGAVDTSEPVVIDAPDMMATPDAMPDAPPCADDDADSVCNEDDDWPCGAKPAPPSNMVAFGASPTTTKVSNVNLGTMGVFAVSAANANLALALRLQVTDTACGGNCIDQLEVGWIQPANNAGNRSGCVFDAAVSKLNGLDTTISSMLRAPMTAGVYDLRVTLAQRNNCGTGTSWWPNGAVPDASRTIAKLCVH